MDTSSATTSIRHLFLKNLALIFVAGTLVLCTVVGMYQGMSHYRLLEEKGIGFARYVAKLSQDPLIMDDRLQLDSIVNEIDSPDILYTVVSNAKGEIVTSRFASLNLKSPRLRRIMGQFAGFDEMSQILGYIRSEEPTLDLSVPIVTGNQQIGTVWMALSKYAIIYEVLEALGFILLINITIALSLGFFLFSSSDKLLLRPMYHLAEAVKRVAGGDLATRIEVAASGEMRALIDGFNAMTEDLQRTTVSREYVDSIIRNMTEGLMILSPECRITFVNDAAVRLFGCGRDEIVGRDAGTHFESSLFSAARELGSAALHGVQRETLCRRADGSEIPVFFSASELTDEDGKLVELVCSLLDITEIRKVSQQLELANTVLKQEVERRRAAQEEVGRLNASLLHRTKELEQVVQELESFSYSVSHDLRAPLRGIDGFSMALLEDYGEALAPDARDYLNRIRNGCRRMGNLIDDLLRLSRITRAEIRRKRVDLSEMVRQVAEEMAGAEPGRAVELAIVPDVVVDADPGLIRTVMENLVGNAWKFTRNKDPGRIEFGSLTNGDTVTCFVRDNGAGFDMSYANKLFGAFQRLHRNEEFEGTGIGLASVKRVIHRHGGRVWAEAKVGEGATFYFTLGGGSHGAENDTAG